MEFSPSLKRFPWMEFTLCVFLGLAVIALFHPGLMTNDSILQYDQALHGQFSDAHPPLMSALWRLLNTIVAGPMGMLIFHVILFFTGLFLLVDSQAVSRPVRLMAIVGITFWPAVFTQLGVIWKDVGLSTSFFLACGLLANNRLPRGRVGLAGLFLFYGVSVRHNAWPAALPLCAWGVDTYWPQMKWRLQKLLRLLAVVGTLVGLQVLTSLVLPVTPSYFGQVIWINDLIGLSVQTHETLLPATSLRPGVRWEDVVKAYRSEDIDTLRPFVALTRDPQELHQLRHRWLSALGHHPYLYVVHRWNGFHQWIGLGTETVMNPYEDQMWANPWNFHFDAPIAFRHLYHYFYLWRDSFIFRGWVYLLCNFVLCGWAWRLGRRGAVLWVSLSGLCYGMGYFFYGVSGDFRYLYWTVMTVFISAWGMIGPEPDAEHTEAGV